jgi:hypothetical protein
MSFQSFALPAPPSREIEYFEDMAFLSFFCEVVEKLQGKTNK